MTALKGYVVERETEKIVGSIYENKNLIGCHVVWHDENIGGTRQEYESLNQLLLALRFNDFYKFKKPTTRKSGR